MSGVLLLNASFEPLQVLPLSRAVVMLVDGKALLEAGTGRMLHSPSVTVEQPDVVRLIRYVKVPRESVEPPWSRRGVFIRDRYQCAYCPRRGDTIDHIHPRDLGGVDSWTNTTACCADCNNKKGNRLLATLGWTMRNHPVAPPRRVGPFLWLDKTPPAWAPYLEPFLPKVTRPALILAS